MLVTPLYFFGDYAAYFAPLIQFISSHKRFRTEVSFKRVHKLQKRIKTSSRVWYSVVDVFVYIHFIVDVIVFVVILLLFLKALCAASLDVRKKSYSPYSKFKVTIICPIREGKHKSLPPPPRTLVVHIFLVNFFLWWDVFCLVVRGSLPPPSPLSGPTTKKNTFLCLSSIMFIFSKHFFP